MKKIKHIDKPWGYEEILEENKHYTVKKLCMRKGKRCSYQYHENKLETAYCLSGELTIIFENREVILQKGEHITIEPMIKHRMYSAKGDAYYLESSTTYPDDVVRV